MGKKGFVNPQLILILAALVAVSAFGIGFIVFLDDPFQLAGFILLIGAVALAFITKKITGSIYAAAGIGVLLLFVGLVTSQFDGWGLLEIMEAVRT